MRLLPHAKVRILNRYSKLFQHCIALARMLSELLSEIYWPVVRPAPPLFSLRADVFFVNAILRTENAMLFEADHALG